ncbi:MAG: phosphate acetyltransferase [Fibrobacterales bacterium]
MEQILFTMPSGHNVGLMSTTAALYRAIENEGVSVSYFKPFTEHTKENASQDRSVTLINGIEGKTTPSPISLIEAEQYLSNGDEETLMEMVVERFDQISQNSQAVVIEGIASSATLFYTQRLNNLICRALKAKVILVIAEERNSPEEIVESVNITNRQFTGDSTDYVVGCIVNKVGAEKSATNYSYLINKDHTAQNTSDRIESLYSAFEKSSVPLSGVLCWDNTIATPRTKDIFESLSGEIINEGDWTNRRIEHIEVGASSIGELTSLFKEQTLIMTSDERCGDLLAACMAEQNEIKLAGIALCGEKYPSKGVLKLCQAAFKLGLPVMWSPKKLFSVVESVARKNSQLPNDDIERAEKAMNTMAKHINPSWLKQLLSTEKSTGITPPAFRNNLIKMAREYQKRIVLPEGHEPRTIEAAIICTKRKIARCVLLGNPAEIKEVAEMQGLELPQEMEIIEPNTIIDDYVAPMVELRKKKGLSPLEARIQLQDTVVLGTMMLQQGHVDGLVSGAVHTTADTIRPAFQLIKTAPNSNMVSSIFFMCLPNQVVVFGDCAINPNPTSEQLAEIATLSAQSAEFFGIDARVAMISYSTGSSGVGQDVELVTEATRLIKEKSPELFVDGPLQYDAAMVKSVGKKKAPDSKVAGEATVVIFPDLNTGNTTYKAVQRSANVVAIGPMLQGLAKPVNDLSRGALVEDIVFTIALTAIQAQQFEDAEKNR